MSRGKKEQDSFLNSLVCAQSDAIEALGQLELGVWQQVLKDGAR